ncbi:hypothetical protein CBER1_00230 [Cercospora berteroae]|uniref:FAD-binding PCMH-type domain-containing protein n=1 Tax=Cercospora berteroae TaxID=357750 RepID=A0A2S6CDH0_9PEZI|nr:hypothetical protein CBER1_00230 [Cercospora berteroae]
MALRTLLLSAIWAIFPLLLLCPLASASTSSVLTRRICNANPASSAQIAADLKPFLSEHAVVVLPGDKEEWGRLTARSSGPKISPGYLAIVEVAAEEDVQNVIHYANLKGLPFLAVSTGHAWAPAVNDLQNGIQISMRKLQSVKVDDSGNTATVGGGATQNTTLKALAKAGKRTVHGLCECTSVIGPALGGGHSMLQGQHGFSADNIVSARLILANSTAITVSPTSHPELFWGLRGAGHNFGIVTSFQTKVYDVPSGPHGLWTLTILTFSPSTLERFFKTWNDLETTYPDPKGLLVLDAMFNRNPLVDPTNNPMITLIIAHEGSNPIANDYISAFQTLNPTFSTQESSIPWELIHDKMGLGDPPVCQLNWNLYGVTSPSLRKWNVTNMRENWGFYEDFTKEHEFLRGSFYLLESYGRGKAMDLGMLELNAVAREERETHILPALMLIWEGGEEAEQEAAGKVADRARALMKQGVAGAPHHTYVNYAKGDGTESLEDMYGRDAQRLRRLRSLKRKWDPENRFGFNAPLI